MYVIIKGEKQIMKQTELKTIKISTQNSKLGAMIPSINLPAITTCRANAPCRKGCYACKGRFLYSNVQKSMENNYNIYKESSKAYFSQIQAYLTLMPYKYFRYHSSGDIVDYNYFVGMVETAKKCKKTHFLCFTKKYEIVNEWLSKNKELPKNLVVVFSSWGLWLPENPYNLPMTYVKFNEKMQKLNEAIPNNARECKGNCATCQMCWKLKQGQSVYFHKH